MSFSLHVSDRAERSLRSIPERDTKRILRALEAMVGDPLAGDVVKLKEMTAFRRRVGNYRIIFGVDFLRRAVLIHDVLRRTTTTYR